VTSRLVFDTSVYIAILRDRAFAGAFRERYMREVARTHVCSVVVEELLAGVRTPLHRKLAEALYAPFERVRRIIVPTHRVWKETGVVLAKLWTHDPAARNRTRFGLVNDALIALTTRSIGGTVVTRNGRDFRLIQAIRPFDLEIV
jgi:predicted nucleic acid-binding protein